MSLNNSINCICGRIIPIYQMAKGKTLICRCNREYQQSENKIGKFVKNIESGDMKIYEFFNKGI
jgi:hypothetical protein